MRSSHHDTTIYKYARAYMHQMFKMRLYEFGRLHAIFKQNGYIYAAPLYEHHLKMGYLDRVNLHVQLKWDDASLTVNYFHYVIERIKKYGLVYGTLSQKKFPDYENNLKEEEDKLTEYFLYEMRKEPVPDKNYPEMPVL
jgi:hypothetical protein